MESHHHKALHHCLRTWLRGCLHAALLMAMAASAQVSTPRFATVWRLQGEVTATPESGSARRLALGDPVFVNEQVRAGATAEAVLQTTDASLIALRPNAVMVAERFVAQGQPSDQATVRVLEGGLRLITGWIGQLNPRAYRVLTPTATIGIRGTDHEPYVLNEALAQTLRQAEGSYDKVNRGSTTLDVGSNSVAVEPGKVGFARAGKPAGTRALMTLVLPVLLDTIPNFYVPGQFDAELDRLSAQAADSNTRQLAQRRKAPACDAQAIAQQWLAQLDAAMARRDSTAVLQLFAPQASVRALVRDQGGTLVRMDLARDAFVQSSIAALQSLSDYSQQRLSLQAQPLEPERCNRIHVQSAVLEQGKQNGQAYRFESTEAYVLEQQQGLWRAESASTTQK